MEIKINKNDFVKTLSLTTAVVGSKNTIPILNNILIRTNKPQDQITVIGTDLEIGVQSTCPAQITTEGAVTMPAKKFYDIIRELPESEIEIVVGKNNAVNIKAKKTFFKILGLAADDFPEPPEFTRQELFEIEQKTLKHCLSATVFAVSHDEARYTLNGILIMVKNGHIRFVATDGKRLAFVEKEINLPKTLTLEAIIPAKAVFELAKNLSETGTAKIAYSQNQILFEFDGTTVISRLIEGKFPNY